MPKNLLTVTSKDRTIDVVMESGTRKLLDRREVLRRQRMAIDQEWSAIEQALTIIEFKAGNPDFAEMEGVLTSERPFKDMSLADACQTLMNECGQGGTGADIQIWLDKSEVEHLLSLGGYQFGKGDPTNSIEVTLRRLAAQDKCSVQKRGGPHSSKYSSKTEGKLKGDVRDSETTRE